MAPELCMVLCSLVLLASLTFPSHGSRHLGSESENRAALFVFGDSLFDPGNNNYINTSTAFQANFVPYGESFFKYPTGRFCDGRIVPDFIAQYAKLQLIPPYLSSAKYQYYGYGWNFASGGAGALDETFSAFNVVSLKMQLNYFANVGIELKRKIGKTEAERLLSNAVYLFGVGSNDYLSTLETNSSLLAIYGPQEYVNLVVGNFTDVIKEIYWKGGRKFALMNLGPLGCLPGLRTTDGDCREEVTALAKLHNVVLQTKLLQLENELQGFRYSFFDFFATAEAILDNPLNYGLTEVKSACCGSGPNRGIFSCGGKRGITEYELCENAEQYLFFDSNHPTEAAYRIVSELMWSGVQNLTGPYNLNSLFQLNV